MITLKAGMPTKVVFTGRTRDCVGKPKFGSLNKQTDIRKTGSGTMDLGPLRPGTYRFTCGMDVNEGSIVPNRRIGLRQRRMQCGQDGREYLRSHLPLHGPR
jgi:hypothetical protein